MAEFLKNVDSNFPLRSSVDESFNSWGNGFDLLLPEKVNREMRTSSSSSRGIHKRRAL
jgi:hypothetical protein